MDDVQVCVEQFYEAKGRAELFARSLKEKKKQAAQKKHQAEVLLKAKWVLTEVARLTQERFKGRVESLVTMAIKAVFDRPFGFELVFERKRNKMECKPIVYEILEGGGRVEYDDPKEDVGGSLIDVISFALRVVLWSLERPRRRSVIILDEPMKNMGKLTFLGGQMLKEVSRGLGFQLIIVTHDKRLARVADSVYLVKHNGVFSEVKKMLDCWVEGIRSLVGV